MWLARRASLLLFLLASLACLGCDQLTKDLARERLAHAPPTSYAFAFGTLVLSYAENPGAFLSLGAGLPEPVRRLAFVFGVPLVLAALCFSFLRKGGLSPLGACALGLVVGGGLSNWLDRILRDGAVTDFLRLGVGPLRTGIFNLADVAILGGLGLMLLGLWRAPGPRAAGDPPGSAGA